MAKKDKGKESSSPFLFEPSDLSYSIHKETSGASPVVEDKLSKKTRRPKKEDPAAAPENGRGGKVRASWRNEDDIDLYMQQFGRKPPVAREKKVLIASAVLCVVAVPLLLILPTGVFGSDFSSTPSGIFEAISENIVGLANMFTGGPVVTGVNILFWQMLAAAVVGASLALSGCIYQSSLNNALASPSTLGVTSGGTLGTLIYTLLFGIPVATGAATITRASEVQAELDSMDMLSYVFATQGRALFSLAGCFAIVGLILLISYIAGHGKVSKVALLIAGQVFSSVIASAMTVIRIYISYYGTEEQMEAIQGIVGGSLGDITSPFTFMCLFVPFLVCAVIMMALRFKLNILSFGSEEARAMGIDVTKTSNAAVAVCTALTAVSISMVGAVGFVGFIVPHVARRLIGHDLRYLLPASMLFGAIFLMTSNYLMNMSGILSGSLGTFTSIIGTVFFLIVVIRGRGNKRAAWI